MLTIRILGLFGLHHTGQAITPIGLRDQTTAALLKYLVLHRGQVVTQEVLIEHFWPDSEPGAGRASLHAAISHLRRVLEPGLDRPAGSTLIKRMAGGYRFQGGPDCEIDHDRYQQWHLEAEARALVGDWGEVVAAASAAEALVSGELLACEPYADWVSTARMAFAQERVALLELALLGHARLEQWRAVATVAQRALRIDPAREGIYRHLMLAYAALNETALALRAYDDCRRVLAAEEGVEPSPATQAIHTELLLLSSSSASDAAKRIGPVLEPSPRPSPKTGLGVALAPGTGVAQGLSTTGLGGLPLIGRDRYLADLPLRVLAGGLVIISGEPGVGKSRLTLEALHRLDAAEVQLLAAACQELEVVPFQPLAEAFGALWPQMAPPSTGAETALLLQPEQSNRQELFAQTLAHLQQRAQEKRLVLYLDDIHWADLDTIQLLHYLLRQMIGQPFTVLATARQAEQLDNAPLMRLKETTRRAGRLTEITLEPLNATDFHRLVEACAAESPDRIGELADQLYQESGGFPLYALERIRDLMESGSLWTDQSGGWRWPPDLTLDGLPLPEVVVSLARRRAARLSNPASQLLRSVIVLGQPAPFRWLAAASGDRAEELLDGLDQLLAHHLLVERQKGAVTLYDISHQLLRKALYRELSAARRAHLHRQAGESLAALGDTAPSPPPALIAHQFAAGQDHRQAIIWFRKAAALSRKSMAYADAITHLERALDLAEGLVWTEAIAAASEELAEALVSRGERGERAGLLYQQALRLAQSDGDRARITLGLAGTYLTREHGKALVLAEEAGRLAQASGREELVAAALICQAQALHNMTRYPTALAIAQRAVEAFRGIGDPAGEAQCHLEISDTLLRMGRLEEARQSALDGLGLYRQLGDRQGEIAGRMRLIKLGLTGCRWQEACRETRVVLAMAETAGLLHWAARAHHCLGWGLFRLGDPEQATSHLEQAILLSERLGARRVLVDAHLTLALVRADQERMEEADRLSTEAVSMADGNLEPEFVVLALVARSTVLRLRGDASGAMAALQRALLLGESRGQQALIYLYTSLAEVQVDLRQAKEALETAGRVISLTQSIGLPLEEAQALRVQGRALALLGRSEEGLAALRESVAQLEALGASVELRRTQEVLTRLEG